MQNNPNNDQSNLVNPNSNINNINNLNSPIVNTDLNYAMDPNLSFNPSPLPTSQVETSFDPNLDYNNFNQPDFNQQSASVDAGYANFDYNNNVQADFNQGFDPQLGQVSMSQNSNLPNLDSQYQNANQNIDQNAGYQLPQSADYYQDPNQPYVESSNNQSDGYNDPYSVNNSSTLPQVGVGISSTSIQSNVIKKKSNLIWYIVSGVVMLILISIIGFLGFWFTNQNNANSDVNTTNTTTQSSSNDSINSTSESLAVSSSSLSSSASLALSNISSTTSQLQTSTTSGSINADTFKDPKAPSPAALARKNTDTVINTLYLKKYFPADLSDDGKCKNELICGNTADSDSDGLANLEEYNYDTDPIKNDSDSDGLADGDEVKIYGTNPNAKDSDFDKYDDIKELATCYDPAIKTSNKIATTKKQQISDLIKTTPLHEPTVSTMKTAGATDGDIVNGYITRECTMGLVGGQN